MVGFLVKKVNVDEVVGFLVKKVNVDEVVGSNHVGTTFTFFCSRWSSIICGFIPDGLWLFKFLELVVVD